VTGRPLVVVAALIVAVALPHWRALGLPLTVP
jgi:hypothetical protein